MTAGSSTLTGHVVESAALATDAVVCGLRPGARVGACLVVDELARGGMGVVYRALQPSLQREVALKWLPAHLVADDDLAARFLREARAAGALSHEHLVRIYDAGVHRVGAWFTMELVEGRSLRQEIEASGRVSPERALEVGVAVVRALEALSAAGVVHRDVKPDNVLLGDDGSIKLADLGLARTPGRGDLTLEGDFLGTPAYVAPEQAADPRCADARSDLWALGATLHHALFGRPPFEGRSNVDVLRQSMRRDVRLPPCASALPRELRAALSTLLARKPDDRYPSPADARRALERALAAVRARRAPPRRRRARAAGALSALGVGLLVSAGAAGLALGAIVGTCPTTQRLISP